MPWYSLVRWTDISAPATRTRSLRTPIGGTDMTTNTNPFRVRVLGGIMRMLGRLVAVCARRLLNAGVSIPDITLMFMSESSAAHPDIITERLLVL